MKKILLVAGLLFCSQTIFAQLEKGMIAVGLSSAFNYTKKTNEVNNSGTYPLKNIQKNSIYNISPTFSYFLSSKFAVGLSIGYTGSTSKQESQYYQQANNLITTSYYTTPSNGVSVSPFVKYYIPLSDQVFFFLKGGIGTTYNHIKSSGYYDETIVDANGNAMSTSRGGDYSTNERNSFSYNVGISPGILFMPTKKIGLEFSLGNVLSYNHSQDDGGNINFISGKNSSEGFQFLNFNTMNVGTSIYYLF